MKKFLSGIIFFLAISLIALENSSAWEFALVNLKKPCENQNGVWRQFGNDCADYCYAKIDKKIICTKSVLTYGCDCGENRCWDKKNESCVSIKNYKIEFDKKEEERKKAEELEAEKAKTQSSLGNLKNSLSSTSNSSDNKNTAEAQNQTPTPSDPNQDYLNYLSQSCKNQNGIWRDFGKSCSGTCESKAAEKNQVVICNALVSFSCDCGENRCWYQNQCIEVSKYKAQKNQENPQENNTDEKIKDSSTNNSQDFSIPSPTLPEAKTDNSNNNLNNNNSDINIPNIPFNPYAIPKK